MCRNACRAVHQEGKQIDKLTASISHSIPLSLFLGVRDSVTSLGFQNVDFRVAPFECDHQLVYLASIGVIDVIVATDSDYLLNGVKIMVSSLSQGLKKMVSRGLFGTWLH